MVDSAIHGQAAALDLQWQDRPIIVVMGVCGCGKSHIGRALAERRGFAFLEGDELHPPANVQRMAAGQPLTDADRRDWLAAVSARIARAHREGLALVVACSALKRRYREELRAASDRLVFLHLTGERSLVESRLLQRRGHFMPASLLDSQLADLEPPQADEPAVTLTIDRDPEALVALACRRLGLGEA